MRYDGIDSFSGTAVIAGPLPPVPPQAAFRHEFVLEVLRDDSKDEGPPRGRVLVRLLGPFSAK